MNICQCGHSRERKKHDTTSRDPLWTREACQGYLNRASSAEGFIQSLTIALGIGNGYEPVEWEKIAESASELRTRIATLEREKAELLAELRGMLELWNSEIIQGRLNFFALRCGGTDGTDEERAWVRERVEKAETTLKRDEH